MEMKNTLGSRPFTSWILILLNFILGIGAVIGGAMLFVAPDGRLLQMSTDALKGTLFSDFLIPGLILFAFMGLLPVFSAIV
jgi:hypothetical protein